MSKIDEFNKAKATLELVRSFFGEKKERKNVKMILRMADVPYDAAVRSTIEIELCGMPVLRSTSQTDRSQQEEILKIVLPYFLRAIEVEFPSLRDKAVDLAESSVELARMDAKDEALEVLNKIEDQ